MHENGTRKNERTLIDKDDKITRTYSSREDFERDLHILKRRFELVYLNERSVKFRAQRETMDGYLKSTAKSIRDDTIVQ